MLSLCSLSWSHLVVAGIACDVAGAIVLGWSVLVKTPRNVWMDAFYVSQTGFIHEAAEVGARQVAEVQVGLLLLATGFVMQGAGYFVPGGILSLSGWRERVLGLVVASVAWLVAFAGYRLYVPWKARRIYRTVTGNPRLPSERRTERQRAEQEPRPGS